MSLCFLLAPARFIFQLRPGTRGFTQLSPRGGFTEYYKRDVERKRARRRLKTAKYLLRWRDWYGPGQKLRSRPDPRPDHRPQDRPPINMLN